MTITRKKERRKLYIIEMKMMAHFEQIPLRIANKNEILLNESEQNNRVELQKRGKLRKKPLKYIKYYEYV